MVPLLNVPLTIPASGCPGPQASRNHTFGVPPNVAPWFDAVTCRSTIGWLASADTTLRFETLGTWSGIRSVTGVVRPLCCTATSARGPGAASFATATVNSHHTDPWLRSRDFRSETVTPVDGVISID